MAGAEFEILNAQLNVDDVPQVWPHTPVSTRTDLVKASLSSLYIAMQMSKSLSISRHCFNDVVPSLPATWPVPSYEDTSEWHIDADLRTYIHLQNTETRKRILVSPPARSPERPHANRYLSRGPRKGMRQDRSPSLGIGNTHRPTFDSICTSVLRSF